MRGVCRRFREAYATVLPGAGTSRRRSAVKLACLVSTLLAPFPGSARAQEFRALWADTFHAGLRTAAEVSQLVADARAGHFNAVVVEVRKRGDAYYNSQFEPKATDVSPATFDPLADLIAKAHNLASGPRIEVHAWIVTYPVWNRETTLPSQPDHPYRLHPDWVSETDTGTTFSGNYMFDPAHPDVQHHLFNVSMDLITRYDLDGFHFDYVRYYGREWGYHARALERFQALTGRTDRPLPTDAQWMQFRRDQVTALVRKVYLASAAVKPWVKISAATITHAPGITETADWPGTAAYSDVLQDWRGWMEEGILDLNLPMAYFDHTVWESAWTRWIQFAKDHQYERHVGIGCGLYLNTLSNALLQMRETRRLTPSGSAAQGLIGYSYAVPNNEGHPRSTFLQALTSPSQFDPNPEPLFADTATVPLMPWKTSPTRGHLRGTIADASNGTLLDGAQVRLAGPEGRALTADATGFFGAVDLLPGTYAVEATNPNFDPATNSITITAGAVTTQPIELQPSAGVTFFQDIVTTAGSSAVASRWTTTSPARCRLALGTTTNYSLTTPWTTAAVVQHDAFAAGLAPGTLYHYRLEAQLGANIIASPDRTLVTAGSVIVDNADAPEAFYTGTWTVGTSISGKYGLSYHTTPTTGGAATAQFTWTPNLPAPGDYEVQVWYPQSSARSVQAPFQINAPAGTVSIAVNQTVNGGGWRTLAPSLPLDAGTNAWVRLSNHTGETNRSVVADAVRWVYRLSQDLPLTPHLPAWWANHFGLSPENGDGDVDHDGASNHAEYVAGTFPNRAASVLRVGLQPDPPSGTVVAFAPFHAGRSYTLEWCPSLAQPQWQAVSEALPEPDGIGGATLHDPTASIGQRYYRLRVELNP